MTILFYFCCLTAFVIVAHAYSPCQVTLSLTNFNQVLQADLSSIIAEKRFCLPSDWWLDLQSQITDGTIYNYAICTYSHGTAGNGRACGVTLVSSEDFQRSSYAYFEGFMLGSISQKRCVGIADIYYYLKQNFTRNVVLVSQTSGGLDGTCSMNFRMNLEKFAVKTPGFWNTYQLNRFDDNIDYTDPIYPYITFSLGQLLSSRYLFYRIFPAYGTNFTRLYSFNSTVAYAFAYFMAPQNPISFESNYSSYVQKHYTLHQASTLDSIQVIDLYAMFGISTTTAFDTAMYTNNSVSIGIQCAPTFGQISTPVGFLQLGLCPTNSSTICPMQTLSYGLPTASQFIPTISYETTMTSDATSLHNRHLSVGFGDFQQWMKDLLCDLTFSAMC